MIGRLALLGAVIALATTAADADAQQATTTTSFGDAPGVVRLPEAVAVAPGGDVLVGDHFSGRVQRFRDGRFVGAFGLRGEGCGRLGAIGGLAVDAQGDTYVLDSDQQLVQVFGPDGTSRRCFGGSGIGRGRLRTGSGGYAASSASGGIAVAGDFVYVADAGNHRVQRFTLDGKNPKIIGKGRLDTPQGLAVKGARLLVADDGHHRVAEFSTKNGRYVRDSAGVKLRFPYDVAFDARGGAYVADNNLHRIVQLDARLKRVRAWGAQGGGHGRFVFPRAVALLPGGDVLVADAGNDRVQQFTATGGYVRTIGTNGRKAPYVTAPADVAANAFGEVAVADGNGRISWFSLDGRYAGGWAQSRSFQQSTAIVTRPNGVDFAPGGRAVRVADSGEVREYADGSVQRLFGAERGSGPGASSLDVAPDGAQWALQSSGTFARIEAGRSPTWLGTRLPQGRSANAIAALADGTVAVAEGTSPHQRAPADGSIIRYDLTGRRVGAWAVPRPPGGLPSRPGGLAAMPDGGAWVSDAANDRLLRYAPDGTIALVLGAPGIGDGQLAEPRGLELDCAGGLLVADSGNDRIVRFAGVVAAPPGCGSAGTPTAAGRPPAPVGLKTRTVRRATHPAARLGTITASCRRSCAVAVSEATVGLLTRGRLKSYKAVATRTGRTIAVAVPAKVAAAMRSAVRAGGSATAGIILTATAKDGVQDTAAVTWTFR